MDQTVKLFVQVRRATSLCIEKDEKKREKIEKLRQSSMLECFREDGVETTSVGAMEEEEDVTQEEEVIHEEPAEIDPAIERQLKKSKAKYRFEFQKTIS